MPSGGKRQGSGRPQVKEEKKRVQISISVSPETLKRINELRGEKIKVGQLVDDLIRQYFEDGL